MTKLRTITADEIECYIELLNKLTDSEKTEIILMIAEWQYAVGFANGMMQMVEFAERAEE